MNAQLPLPQIALLCCYAVGMAGGQLLFKAASIRLSGNAPFLTRILALAQDGFFLAALVLYFGLAVLWVWILSFTPLSRAYPFVALALAITPIIGGIVFAEPISIRLIIGLVVIFGGIILVAG